jgi:predicted transcriptional regulator of viral defense system
MTIVNEITNHFSDYPVFTYRDLRLYFSGKRIKPSNLTRILSYMKSNGSLYTLKKGVYTFKKNDMVSGFAYTPFYYGLLSALTLKDLWTQNSRPEIITIKNVRSSRAQIFNDPKDVIFIHHTPIKYFFGFDIINYGALRLPVSDSEKTLIDLFYYKVKLPLQNYDRLLRSIEIQKVHKYLKAYDRHTSSAVLNFIKKYKLSADQGKLSSPY